MEENDASPLQTLKDIRQLMERSSRFISLSGMSGVFAGIYALAGAYAAYSYLGLSGIGYYAGEALTRDSSYENVLPFIIIDAVCVMVLAIATGIFLTTRKAREDGNSLFDRAARKLIANLCIPLFTGGLFCLALVSHQEFIYVAPSMLVFYGLSLIHASSYTRNHIRTLGVIEVILGLTSLFFLGYGFLFWVLGFGVMHIVYGTYMYFKFEK